MRPTPLLSPRIAQGSGLRAQGDCPEPTARSPQPRNVRALLQAGVTRLKRVGLDHARHEVEWLLGRLLRVRRPELYLSEEPVPVETTRQFWMQLDQRAKGVPLQYLLEEAEFYGLPFTVAPGVFIPRPETETIVEAALTALRTLEARRRRPLRVLDAGTGSGCIAATLSRLLPTCVVVGVELSWDALHIAAMNVRRHGLSSRVRLVQGHWLEPIRGTCDGLVSNPPYIPSAVVDHLPLDVRHEPRASLDGGPDGLRVLAHLMTQAADVLTPGGVLVLECGEGQVGTLVEKASAMRWVKRITPLCDLASRPRGILVTRQT